MKRGRVNQSPPKPDFFRNFPSLLVLIPTILAGLTLVIGVNLFVPESSDRKQAANSDTEASVTGDSATSPRPSAHTFRAWDSDPLPLDDSIQYATEAAGGELKIGPPTTVGGLELQQLRFRLPPSNLCVWSADGK